MAFGDRATWNDPENLDRNEVADLRHRVETKGCAANREAMHLQHHGAYYRGHGMYVRHAKGIWIAACAEARLIWAETKLLTQYVECEFGPQSVMIRGGICHRDERASTFYRPCQPRRKSRRSMQASQRRLTLSPFPKLLRLDCAASG